MKKFFQNKLVFTLLCILGFIVLLVAVIFGVMYIAKGALDGNKQRSEVEETAVPTPSPIPDRNYDEGRIIDFEPNLALMQLGTIEEENLPEYTKEHWLDITPEAVSNEVDCVILKHDAKRYTYLYMNGSYVRLDEGTDGYGVIDMLLCDINFDDELDLIYTYTFGTGEDYCAKVGWYDFTNGQKVVSDFSLQRQEMALESDDGITCKLFRAQRKSGETEGGYVLHIVGDAPFGVLVEQEGRLILKLDAQ